MSFELSIPGPKCLLFGNWHVLSSYTSIYFCLFFCTLLDGLLSKTNLLTHGIEFNWHGIIVLLMFVLVCLFDALHQYFVHFYLLLFSPSIQGHFNTIYYEHLCPEKQGYKKGFFVMLYQMICHKICYFFVSDFSSSCSRAAKDRMFKIFERDCYATGRKASSRWLNWWSMSLGWWLSPECQIIRETSSQCFWCFRWGQAHRGQLKPNWMSFSLYNFRIM